MMRVRPLRGPMEKRTARVVFVGDVHVPEPLERGAVRIYRLQ
jgi:hypothetical protein